MTDPLCPPLEHLDHSAWSRRILEREGKVTFDLDLDMLRQDREFDDHGAIVNWSPLTPTSAISSAGAD